MTSPNRRATAGRAADCAACAEPSIVQHRHVIHIEERLDVRSRTKRSVPRRPREFMERTEQSWRGWVDAVEGIPAGGEWPNQRWGIGRSRIFSATSPFGKTGSSATASAFWTVNPNQLQMRNETPSTRARWWSSEGRVRNRAEALPRRGPRQDSPRTSPPFRIASLLLPQLVETLADETYRHYDDHTEQVRAWRQKNAL